jgi:large subunit ribosomal protein L3
MNRDRIPIAFCLKAMLNTYITTKANMNQVWDKNGKRIVVTILKVGPGVVVQIKTDSKEGYNALVVGFGSQKESRIKSPQLKYYQKNNFKSFPSFTREIKVSNPQDYKIGDIISADQIFSIGDIVNAQGTTKGRGFTGVIKRWGFHGGPRTHGQSDRERAPGSIGQGTDPGRVHRGKKMPGHYGDEVKTIKNLVIANITKDEIWVTGPVPGSINSTIMLTKTKEKKFIGLLNLDEELEEKKDSAPQEIKPENKPLASAEDTNPTVEVIKETTQEVVEDNKEDNKEEVSNQEADTNDKDSKEA